LYYLRDQPQGEFKKENTDKYRCMYKHIKHYTKGATGQPPDLEVPEDVMNDCNNDSNCKFVFANGQNLYLCGEPFDDQHGYDEPRLPRWNKKCQCSDPNLENN